MRVYEQINALPPAGIGKKSANIIAAGSAGCPQLARRQGGTVMNNEGRKAHLVGSGIANLAAAAYLIKDGGFQLVAVLYPQPSAVLPEPASRRLCVVRDSSIPRQNRRLCPQTNG